MRSRPGNTLLALATGVALTLSNGADAGLDAARVVERLQAWLDATRDLQCRFEQTLQSGALGDGIRETGRLYLKRPGRMRWEYTRPEPKVALLNDDEALLYLPEDRQLIRGDAAWGQSLLPRLLSGEGRVAALFEASLVAGPETGGHGAYRLRLVPRTGEEGFQEITVTLELPAFAITEADVLDDMGNRMSYRFRSIRRNRGLDDGLFVLTPPPGTDVIDPA